MKNILKRIFLSIFFTLINIVESQAIQLKVLTYNTWLFGPDTNFDSHGPFAPDISSRVNKICDLLKSHKWDVVFLQEVWAPNVRERLKNCGMNASAANESLSSLSGLMTFSKFKIVRTARFPFNKNGELGHFQDGELMTSKSMLFTEIETPSGSIYLGNIHAVARYSDWAYDKQREAQLKMAAGIMSAYPNAILAGDFNLSPNGYSYSYVWNELRYTWLNGWEWSSPTKSTYTPENPNVAAKDGIDEGALDHIFSSPGSQINNSLRVFDINNEILSDHFGWEALIEF